MPPGAGAETLASGGGRGGGLESLYLGGTPGMGGSGKKAGGLQNGCRYIYKHPCETQRSEVERPVRWKTGVRAGTWDPENREGGGAYAEVEKSEASGRKSKG